jgi:hypothetical protein
MCRFLSAIVTRQGNVYCNPLTDSHEDLIEMFSIKDSKPMQNFVRVEYTPESQTEIANIEKYNLSVDEDYTPEWFDEGLRDKTIRKLKSMLKKMIITEDRKILIGDAFILDHVNIGVLRYARVISMAGGSVNVVWDGGSVNVVWDGGSVNVVRAGGSVNEVWNGGSVNEVWAGGSVNEVWNGGSVNEVWAGGQIKKDYRKNNKPIIGGSIQ